jgi:hypothetical protein
VYWDSRPERRGGQVEIKNSGGKCAAGGYYAWTHADPLAGLDVMVYCSQKFADWGLNQLQALANSVLPVGFHMDNIKGTYIAHTVMHEMMHSLNILGLNHMGELSYPVIKNCSLTSHDR